VTVRILEHDDEHENEDDDFSTSEFRLIHRAESDNRPFQDREVHGLSAATSWNDRPGRVRDPV